MKIKEVVFAGLILGLIQSSFGQSPQGFFLADWQPRTTTSPEYNDVPASIDPVTLAVTVDFSDTLTKVPDYLFGDNANLWTGWMSDNKTLMKHIADREIGVLRGPGGSISDVFFWNRNKNQWPPDVPAFLLNDPNNKTWPWYGDRPESWTMDVDSFYSILSKVDATGMITVNYGYARYGTSANPVAQAAHMAADWVRYDNGRSKFWEIGNEVSGSWEAGYRIDRTQNQDGQPEYINPTLYGQHCLVFIDSMKAAAQEVGAEIKIGLVMHEGYSSSFPTWNKDVAAVAGDKADFYVVHSYFTPYNTNSDVATVLNSYTYTGIYKANVWNEVAKAGKPKLPVALTEYNIFAVGSNQPVSHANGMHAVLVTGEAMKTGYGAATRWDLANGYDNGNDHGMFAYNEDPDLPDYTPHPAFFHLYYMRKHTGDVLLNSSMTGAAGVVIIPTAFSSGQIGASLVNTAKISKVVRLNLKDYKVGDRFYTYTLTGTEGVDFSRKVFVNGAGPTRVAGGPADYEAVKANSSVIGDEIRIVLPPLSAVYVLVEPGTKTLAINNEVTSVAVAPDDDDIVIYPNPSAGSFTVKGLPEFVNRIEIQDLIGATVFIKDSGIDGPEIQLHTGLAPGMYLVSFSGRSQSVSKKILIK